MSITAPISYWKLDESSGNASDSVGSNTLTNNNTVAYATGKINNGIDLGTGNTNKSLSYTTRFGTMNGDKSISTWVRLNTDKTGGDSHDTICEWAFGSSSNFVGYELLYERISSVNQFSVLRDRGCTGGERAIFSGPTVAFGYYHVLMTLSGTTMSLYVNGTLANTVTINTGNGSCDSQDGFYVGQQRSGVQWASLRIDEIGIWNVALTVDEVSRLYNAGRGNTHPFTNNLETSLVSYHKLDEASGNASDSIGSNTLTNIGTVTYATGKINNGGVFNGSSQYFTYPNTIQTGAGVWSVNLWVKTSSSGSYKEISFWGTEWPGKGIDIYMNKSNKLASNFFSGGGRASSTTSINTNAWIMVTVTYNGSLLRVYVDGTLEGTGASFTGSIVSSLRYIGVDNSINNHWNGSMDEMGMWSRTLSAPEITELYNSGSGKSYPLIGIVYTLLMERATFILTGRAMFFKRKMIAAAGSYILTGVDAFFKKGFGMFAAAGSYILTGRDAFFRKALRMIAERGIYLLTGRDAFFRRGFTMIAEKGIYILTGFSVVTSFSGWAKKGRDIINNWTKKPRN